jgi:hypothetical protein
MGGGSREAMNKIEMNEIIWSENGKIASRPPLLPPEMMTPKYAFS